MTAKEMFEALGYKEVIKPSGLIENLGFIEYIYDYHGDGDFKFITFNSLWKEYAVGYYDGYETKTELATKVTIKEHEAITKQMKELGWVKND